MWSKAGRERHWLGCRAKCGELFANFWECEILRKF